MAEQIEAKVRAEITERVLREADLDEQITAAVAKIKAPDGAVLAGEIAQLFESEPDAEWRNHIKQSRASRQARHEPAPTSSPRHSRS